MSADELNAQGPVPAPPVTGLPEDGCLEYWRFPDELELVIDFETMTSATDGFKLRHITGYLHSGLGTASVFIRAGHDDLSTRSLLLLGNRSSLVGLSWWGCLNVSTRRGLRFWAKGLGSASVRPDLPKVPAEGECVPQQVSLDLTEDWRTYEYAWESFCPAEQAPVFAQRLAGMRFVLQPTQAEPWLAIDDVSFFD